MILICCEGSIWVGKRMLCYEKGVGQPSAGSLLYVKSMEKSGI